MKYHPNCTTGNNYLDEALENYLMHGFEPGGFLTSVLANDLRLSVGRADHWNKNNLPSIVDAITYCVPDLAWGSYQRVKDWCNDKNGYRSAYADRKEKEYMWRILKGDVREKVPEDPPF